MKHLVIVILMLSAMSGCAVSTSDSVTRKTEETKPSDRPESGKVHTSQNALDWTGRYHGVLPCADCIGVDTLLTLNRDLTYVLERRYIEPGENWQVHQGRFSWRDNGSVIELKGVEWGPGLYQVGENSLYHLTEQGHRVSCDLAQFYHLNKLQRQFPVIEGIKWNLMALHGQPVEVKGDRPFFRIHPDTHKVTGIAGCNRFFGQFSQDAPGIVDFGQLGATQMACPNLAIEQSLFNVLATAEHVSRKGNQLQLTKGKHVLAWFEAELRR